MKLRIVPARRHFRSATERGVTLIELLIVVVVVAILASIAVPSYRSYVLRSHRVDATSAMLDIAARQEKFFLACNTYTENLAGSTSAADCNDRGLGFPDGSGSIAGVQSANAWYTLEVEADADNFSVSATAIGGQAEDSDCATFGIDETGARTATGTKCWR